MLYERKLRCMSRMGEKTLVSVHCHDFRSFGFIEHLQNVTKRSYSAIANSHAQQFATAHTKYS
jgi:hypothetical protein